MLSLKTIFSVTTISSFLFIYSHNSVAKPLTADDVKQAMDLWKVPALAVSVVTDKNVEFQQGFGKTNINNGSNVDEHTQFGIMSTTKAMVAAGILILADQEKLGLDDLVIKHIPELHFEDPSLDQQITIRDLLAHRTGLPSTDFWIFWQKTPLEVQINRLKSIEPSAPPRSRFMYQNTMYELAGEIIKRVTGKRWDHFLKEALWLPIGMHETYGNRVQIAPNLQHVSPFEIVDGEVVDTGWSLDDDEASAAGSVWSSIHDMSLWAQFLLNDGKTAKGLQLISTASLSEMFTPQMLVEKSNYYPTHKLTHPNWVTYGLGWFQQDFQGRKIDFHTGSLSGLIAVIGLDRANNKAMVVLGNLDHAEVRHGLLWHVMDTGKNADSPDWNQLVFDLYQQRDAEYEKRMKEFEKSRLSQNPSSLPITDYAGTYTHESYGDLAVVVQDQSMSLESKRYKFKLSHWHFDTFEMTSEEFHFKSGLNFTLGMNGKVKGLTLYGLDFLKTK